MRVQAPQTTHLRSTAAARCGQPCMVHVAIRATFSASKALQQAEQQQQPCSSDVFNHSSSSRVGGTGDPLSLPQPVQRQQQQEQLCMQQPDLSSSLQLLPLVAAHQLWSTLYSLPVHAAETIPPEAVALFKEFLDQIAALGPWGGALFVLTVMTAEMVPLFPTQPLTLASGLLFGPVKGALFVVIGVTLAAVNAYSLAKGVGRSLAQKVIAAEMSGEEGGGAVAKQLSAVTQAIESGGFMRQVTAITLLRLTPVVPFSASNYLLGLTPVELGPLVVGTVAGMSVWSILYASLGGASKALLESGADLDVLLADLGDKAGQYSSDVAVLGLIVGLLLGGGYFVTQRAQQQQISSSSSSSPTVPPPAVTPLETPREEILQGQQKL